MKLKSTLAFSLCAAIGLVAAILYSGCESADTYGIEISQSSQEVKSVGQTVALTATGWSGYLWTLEDKSYGRLNRTTGSSVIYTVTAMPDTSKDIKIKVAGTGTGVDASSSSNTSSMATGSTIIRHTVMGAKTPEKSESAAKISVTPDWKKVTAVGEVVELKATGGTDYVWSLDQKGWARIEPSRGSASVKYIVEKIPTNSVSQTIMITVSDPNSSTTGKGVAEIQHTLP